MNRRQAEDLRRQIETAYPDASVEAIPDPDGLRLVIDLECPSRGGKTLMLSIGDSQSLLLRVLLPGADDPEDAA